MGGPKIRAATPADIPAILDIIRALRKEPLWNYCFPFRTDAAEDLSALKRIVENSTDRFAIRVLEVPIKEPESNNLAKIVSVAVWDKAVATKGKGEDGPVESIFTEFAKDPNAQIRKGVAAKHVQALEEAISKCQHDHGDKHGPQIMLQVIATHPEHQGLGYARLLLHHILTHEAHASGRAVTAVASPSGYVFYSGLGFRDCGYTALRAEGDADEMVLKSMVAAAPPPREARRASWLGATLVGGGRLSAELDAAEGSRRGSWGSLLGLGHSGGSRRASSEMAGAGTGIGQERKGSFLGKLSVK